MQPRTRPQRPSLRPLVLSDRPPTTTAAMEIGRPRMGSSQKSSDAMPSPRAIPPLALPGAAAAGCVGW